MTFSKVPVANKLIPIVIGNVSRILWLESIIVVAVTISPIIMITNYGMNFKHIINTIKWNVYLINGMLLMLILMKNYPYNEMSSFVHPLDIRRRTYEANDVYV